MSRYLETLTLDLRLTEYGDALIYGTKNHASPVPGLQLKQRLFAWHEASFYGTELEVQELNDDIELVLLPAEQVIPFFADPRLLVHIEWEWQHDALLVVQTAKHLAPCMEQRQYIPSLDAYRQGKLQWKWDLAALGEEAKQALGQIEEDEDLAKGLQAAYSAAVFQRCYGTEETAADLRQDYPLLFARDRAASAGRNEQAWLIAVGWRADPAPFRPILQLLDPDDSADWRLQLVLQDRRDASVLHEVRISSQGAVYGDWPEAWDVLVRERSEGWIESLRDRLPSGRFRAGSEDILGAPLSDAEAWSFLTVDSLSLLEAGWQVLLPSWWEAARRRKPKLRAKVKGDKEGGQGQGKKQSLFGLDALIDFDWRIAIGDADLTEAEFAELVARNERLIRFRGQWIALDPELLAQIQRAIDGIDKSQGLSFQDVLQLHLRKLGSAAYIEQARKDAAASDGTEEERAEDAARLQLEVELSGHLRTIIDQLVEQAEWPKLPAPPGLRAELRAYQRDGFSWLAFLGKFGLGACLADDMGLGKTVQLIAYLLHRRQSQGDYASGPSLIICPTSVLGNWQKELNRFAPSLRLLLHYGSRRDEGETFLRSLQGADIVLTSYATAALDQELLREVNWSSLCLDEAQNIKNAQTRQSIAVRSLKASHRIALTGTPIENRLSELWSIYDFITPGYLGTGRAFQERFAKAIEQERDERRMTELQRLVKPFMLRRKKKDPAIQLDLPEKNEMKTYLHLTAEQGALYDQTVNELLDKAKALKGIERKGAILSSLTQLKQLCDHPALLAKETLPEAGSPEAAQFDWETLTSRSSKLERLVAMVKEIREEGERCLIFTQYIGMGLMLRQVLERELGEPLLYLNGSTSKTARDRMVESFQAGGKSADGKSAEEPDELRAGAFILSLKAGGVGLNLTAANHVFHFDRWWNPAVENQATDRAYRMGQTRDVQVHKFIALGTLEERIDEMLESKQQLSDDIISASEGWITELSTDALRDLVTLRKDWA